jgi:tetratricopeptide (TPR) repeat protein
MTSMADLVESQKKRRTVWKLVLRCFLALLVLFVCYRLIVDSATTGLSRFLSTLAIVQARIEPADAAVRLAPRDPEAHYTRALTLVNLERLPEAVAELQQATQLRPHHYYEWLDLGVTLDRLGDQAGAVAALGEAVRLAPSFAQPHWQLGNLIYRQGRFQEAFAEFRWGARSNPNLVEGMLDLAWAAADGDAGTVEGLIQPQTRRSHLELARYLARQGKGAEAAKQVREAGEPQDDGERTLLHQTISALLTAEQFPHAYSAWAATHSPAASNTEKGPSQFLNGSFVDPIVQDDPGFGWQLLPVPNVSAAIDPSGPSPATRSIRLQFSGDNALGNQLIYQLLLLEPGSRYSLSFVARAENLVSGGPPVILALSASGKTTKILGQSEPLSPGTTGWTTYKVDFSTDQDTSAVVIALRRLACDQSPCPIFGKLWLSGFSLAKT